MDQAAASDVGEGAATAPSIRIGSAEIKLYIRLLQKAYRRHAMREVKEVIDKLSELLQQVQ